MPIMQLDLTEATDRQSYTVYGEFMPDMGNRFGYQLGYLSGMAERNEAEPFKYKCHAKALLVTCPMFDGHRAAISFRLEVLQRPWLVYSKEHEDMVVKLLNRLAIVTMPDDDGQFTVLLVQSNPDDTDDVVDQSYDYEKSLADPAGSFTKVVTNMVAFLTKGEIDAM